ncbi:uncharacterized protein PITG_16084 [Phytophthora infestans T30-4]|uniref:Secreted RxLR effector peptide protein n=2 Tax=Phytophthora infestans TaxID=4787 RepID=D0NSU6_PHYIT|nr:uncharacterized protein PITG_16084 [Phytophthora infestans T30-4]EEY64658.1 conserved hypothetical protein [Phytophthora infestans T30-4]KAF4039257.1 hypothetical protein GN244_ATG08690 [Phytophthora infestans]KAF4138376.1 hypothetical protein GN958_ATG12398 [Phytophthora infestans]KAI9994175.1 hypothetical protein PInf_016740 [Phytophthora infestans]|eukprot:XP_002897858.1 conserved hypothetical protein [Phytophthora infestans T30-4]
MRLTETLLAIAIVLVASSNVVAAASKKTPAKNGLYAELYNVEDGVITNKMRVPLGNAKQYQQSDFKSLKTTLETNKEERAAVHLPRGFNSLISGLERFVGLIGKPFKWSRGTRRLRVEDA